MAAQLSGSSFPDDHGGYVVTTRCPNEYSYRRLMQLIGTIAPDAGAIAPQSGAIAGESGAITPYIAGFEPNEDGVIQRGGCATGGCDLE